MAEPMHKRASGCVKARVATSVVIKNAIRQLDMSVAHIIALERTR